MATATDGLQNALHITARVQSGNKIEITAPGLQEGQDVDVYLVPRPSETPSHRSVLEFLDSLPSGPRSAPRGMKLSGGSRRNATHGIVDPALLRARLRRRLDLHLQRGEASNLCSDLRPLWEAVARGDLEVLSSELTLMETLIGPLKQGDAALEMDYENFFASPGIRLLPITSSILRAGARLRATLNSLRSPDAIQAATGHSCSCSLFLTNDLIFRRIPGLPVVLLDDVLRS